MAQQLIFKFNELLKSILFEKSRNLTSNSKILFNLEKYIALKVQVDRNQQHVNALELLLIINVLILEQRLRIHQYFISCL